MSLVPVQQLDDLMEIEHSGEPNLIPLTEDSLLNNLIDIEFHQYSSLQQITLTADDHIIQSKASHHSQNEYNIRPGQN